MKTTTKAYRFWGVLAAFGLLFGGCATGPRFEYTEQKDSARIEPPIKPVQRIEQYGSCSIQITRVDGLVASFDASRPGANWVPGGNRPLYVSPGKHTITLDIGQIDEVYGKTGRNDVGVVGAYAAGSRPTLTVEFAPNHAYRFTANLNGTVIDVTLWEETAGTSPRVAAATWRLDSNRGYSENIPPVHSR